MFVGLVHSPEPRRDPTGPLWLDLPELRPWRWYVAAIVGIVLADRLSGWAGLIPLVIGFGCVLYGVTTYTRGNDGLSKYRQ